MQYPSDSNPRRGNYELQQDFLREKQQRISNHLFEIGVVSRLVETQEPSVGVRTEVKGLAQLDKIFTPSYALTQDGDKTELVLSLVAITSTPNNGRSFTYFRLGMIDETGTLYPYPGINHEDAEAVNQAAQELVSAKVEGLLPDLEFDLIGVRNPNTGIQKAP